MSGPELVIKCGVQDVKVIDEALALDGPMSLLATFDASVLQEKWRLAIRALSGYEYVAGSGSAGGRWAVAQTGRCWYELGFMESAVACFRASEIGELNLGDECVAAMVDSLLERNELEDAERVLQLGLMQPAMQESRSLRLLKMKAQLESGAADVVGGDSDPVVEFCAGVMRGGRVVAERGLRSGEVVACCKPAAFAPGKELELLPELIAACMKSPSLLRELRAIPVDAVGIPVAFPATEAAFYAGVAPQLLRSRAEMRGEGLWLAELSFTRSCIASNVRCFQAGNGWRLYIAVAGIQAGEEITLGTSVTPLEELTRASSATPVEELHWFIPRFRRVFVEGVWCCCRRCEEELKFEMRHRERLALMMRAVWGPAGERGAVELEELLLLDAEHLLSPGAADAIRAAYTPVYMIHYLRLPPDKVMRPPDWFARLLLEQGAHPDQLRSTLFDRSSRKRKRGG